jgi:streptomycin 6-kinase
MKTVWRPEDVDAPWLTGVLRGAGLIRRASVVSFESEPVGTGQMADSVRFRLEYDAPDADRDADAVAPATVVGKFTAADPTSRATGVAMRTSEVEVRFYQQVARTLRVPTPACYFADVDPLTSEFVLVMNDLAPSRQGDQLAGCGPDDAAVALEAMAALHAPRWGDPALCDLEWLNRRTEDSNAVGEQLLPVLFAGFVERYGDVLGPEAVAVGEGLIVNLGRYLRDQPGPSTVQHGDFRLDNLLFADGASGPGVTVVDWQTVVLGPALADASYFLGAGLVVEDRRRHEMGLLREYHGRLVADGVSGYSWDDCVTDYRRYAYAGYLMAVGASMMVERTERGDEMFMAMAGRHAAQVIDLESQAILVGT